MSVCRRSRVCIAKRNRGLNSSFTVRKISHGEGGAGVPVLQPERGRCPGEASAMRRAKLYYLRGLAGKAARIKEKIKSSSS